MAFFVIQLIIRQPKSYRIKDGFHLQLLSWIKRNLRHTWFQKDKAAWLVIIVFVPRFWPLTPHCQSCLDWPDSRVFHVLSNHILGDREGAVEKPRIRALFFSVSLQKQEMELHGNHGDLGFYFGDIFPPLDFRKSETQCCGNFRT